MSPAGWLAPERTEVAEAAILDAAERLFAEHGPTGVGMAAIAAEAGCARATLYRYFPNRRALQVAFAHRAAGQVLDDVAALPPVADPVERAVQALLACLAGVRARPTLASWLEPGNAAELLDVLRDSPLVEAVSAGADVEKARWLLRCLVSLLSVPVDDADEEERLVRRFLAPLVS